ncbi:uncharacterized protein BJX67DRAFT_313770 [Aspergillus lucknowensis]|uniref:Uncharacterized protein n=1 Tax=Aspergillus lucknowensis TaxID=176173 RepID=A0ABR4LCB8_9EURO
MSDRLAPSGQSKGRKSKYDFVQPKKSQKWLIFMHHGSKYQVFQGDRRVTEARSPMSTAQGWPESRISTTSLRRRSGLSKHSHGPRQGNLCFLFKDPQARPAARLEETVPCNHVHLAVGDRFFRTWIEPNPSLKIGSKYENQQCPKTCKRCIQAPGHCEEWNWNSPIPDVETFCLPPRAFPHWLARRWKPTAASGRQQASLGWTWDGRIQVRVPSEARARACRGLPCGDSDSPSLGIALPSD